jgi:hypothetical protein
MEMAGHHKGLTLGTGGGMLFSMAEKMSWFSFARSVARTLLQFRETRRKIIFYTIMSLLVVFAIGDWPLAGWLEDSSIRFLFYWGGCAILAIFLFLLGLYDFLTIMKEFKSLKNEHKERL